MSDEEQVRRWIHDTLDAEARRADVDDTVARRELEALIEAAKSPYRPIELQVSAEVAQGRWRPVPNEIIEWAAA